LFKLTVGHLGYGEDGAKNVSEDEIEWLDELGDGQSGWDSSQEELYFEGETVFEEKECDLRVRKCLEMCRLYSELFNTVA
jgi:hypothetical protein